MTYVHDKATLNPSRESPPRCCVSPKPEINGWLRINISNCIDSHGLIKSEDSVRRALMGLPAGRRIWLDIGAARAVAGSQIINALHEAGLRDWAAVNLVGDDPEAVATLELRLQAYVDRACGHAA